jgi:hypothetical protein
VSHGSLLSFGRYLVIAIAAALLAPYAGCHILTSPPNHVVSGEIGEVARSDSKGRAISLDSAERDERAAVSTDDAATTRDLTEPKLSEIENLLREP